LETTERDSIQLLLSIRKVMTCSQHSSGKYKSASIVLLLLLAWQDDAIVDFCGSNKMFERFSVFSLKGLLKKISLKG
jgi:hypothetical protein